LAGWDGGAYQSNEAGQFERSVRACPKVDSGHWTIATSGTKPLWARSGRELFYLDGTNAMTTVPIQTAPTFTHGNPTKLFDGRSYASTPTGRTYDVSRDGQKFLMIKDDAGGDQPSTPASMVVVLNWTEELKRLVPTRMP
jgi:serine/threonine-protein kinase